MSRYKLVQDQVASWIEHVPWLDKYTSKGGRAKVSKRTIVARGLKDAVELQRSRSTDNQAQPARKKRKLSRLSKRLRETFCLRLTLSVRNL